jgi:hypothetical protein
VARAVLALRRSRLRGWAKRALPAALRYRLALLVNGVINRGIQAPAMPAALERRLLDYYREDILRCQDLLRTDLTRWLTPRAGASS